MNEFLAQKLGEVLALAEVGRETFERGKTALESVLGVERVAQVVKDNATHADTIRKISRECEVEEIVSRSYDSAARKMRAMRDIDIDTDWNDSTKLLEWSGLFEGSAVMHWTVILGAAEILSTVQKTFAHNDLSVLASLGSEFHHGLFHDISQALHKVGGSKALETPRE